MARGDVSEAVAHMAADSECELIDAIAARQAHAWVWRQSEAWLGQVGGCCDLSQEAKRTRGERHVGDFVVVPDPADASLCHLPFRDAEGGVSVPLVRRAREIMRTGKMKGKVIPFQVRRTNCAWCSCFNFQPRVIPLHTRR